MLWSDAWVLLASIYAASGRPAALEDVIASADFIQHANITFQEMEGALARLTADGFLLFVGDKLTPTDKTLEFYRRKNRRSVFAAKRDLEEFIGAAAWSPDQKPEDANVGASFPMLTRAAFDAAVKAYRDQLRKAARARRKKQTSKK